MLGKHHSEPETGFGVLDTGARQPTVAHGDNVTGQGLTTLVLQSQTTGARQETMGTGTTAIPVACGDNEIS